MHKKKLRGITWDHSRGFSPMMATSQRFSEMHPDVEITWDKRSLQAFADQSIGMLAAEYDLMVIDHPWIGVAAAEDILLPLDQFIPSCFLDIVRQGSVGHSYLSYQMNGSQWALPIDAATPVAAYRPDLISARKAGLPRTYEELVQMATEGMVILPAVAIDSLMHFYMFCSSLGEDPFQSSDQVVSEEIGTRALKMLKRLITKLDTRCFDWNPVRVYEMMAETDEFAYCPFAYGYSNYARKGYATRILNFQDLVSLEDNRKLIPTLGGTGIAVSARTRHTDDAMAYVQYVTAPACQQTLYFDNGGQPAHLSAWTDYYTNFKCAGFFKATLPALSRSFLRPRYNGYITFQDATGVIVRDYLMGAEDEKSVLHMLDELYHNSIP